MKQWENVGKSMKLLEKTARKWLESVGKDGTEGERCWESVGNNGESMKQWGNMLGKMWKHVGNVFRKQEWMDKWG